MCMAMVCTYGYVQQSRSIHTYDPKHTPHDTTRHDTLIEFRPDTHRHTKKYLVHSHEEHGPEQGRPLHGAPHVAQLLPQGPRPPVRRRRVEGLLLLLLLLLLPPFPLLLVVGLVMLGRRR